VPLVRRIVAGEQDRPGLPGQALALLDGAADDIVPDVDREVGSLGVVIAHASSRAHRARPRYSRRTCGRLASMDSGWGQVWFAIGAALISAGSAWFAFMQAGQAKRQARHAEDQAVQAKRQADAAHGEVEPTFHIQFSRRGQLDWIDLRFVAQNYNRHAMRLNSVSLEASEDLRLFVGISDELGPAIVEFSAGIMRPSPRTSISVGVTLPGVMPGAPEPSRHKEEFTIKRNEEVSKLTDNTVRYTVSYTILDGKREPQTFSGNVDFDRMLFEPLRPYAVG
jgi:hypothetical protein